LLVPDSGGGEAAALDLLDRRHRCPLDLVAAADGYRVYRIRDDADADFSAGDLVLSSLVVPVLDHHAEEAIVGQRVLASPTAVVATEQVDADVAAGNVIVFDHGTGWVRSAPDSHGLDFVDRVPTASGVCAHHVADRVARHARHRREADRDASLAG